MIELIVQGFLENPVNLFALEMLGVLCLLLAVILLVRSFYQRIGQWFQEKPSRIPLGIGVLFLLWAVAMLVNPVRLVMHGKIADGVVTNVVKSEGRDKEGNRTVTSTSTISFKAGDRNIEVRRSSTETQGSTCVAGCESYRKGQRLKIRYLADDPEIYEVDSFGELFGPSLTLGVMGALCIFIWRGVRSSERDAARSKEFHLKVSG